MYSCGMAQMSEMPIFFAVQANRTNGATATPLGPVWVHARYPLSLYIPSVDAACVYSTLAQLSNRDLVFRLDG